MTENDDTFDMFPVEDSTVYSIKQTPLARCDRPHSNLKKVIDKLIHDQGYFNIKDAFYDYSCGVDCYYICKACNQVGYTTTFVDNHSWKFYDHSPAYYNTLYGRFDNIPDFLDAARNYCSGQMILRSNSSKLKRSLGA